MAKPTTPILLCMLAGCGSPPLPQVAEFSATDGILKHIFNKQFPVEFRLDNGCNTARLALNDEDWIDFRIDRINKVLTTDTHFTTHHEVQIALEPTSGTHGFFHDNGERHTFLVLDSDDQQMSTAWR